MKRLAFYIIAYNAILAAINIGNRRYDLAIISLVAIIIVLFAIILSKNK